MTAAIKAKQPRPRFFKQMFKTKLNSPTLTLAIDSQFRGVRIAQFTSIEAVANGREKLTFESREFTLPTLRDLQTLTATEIAKRMVGEAVWAIAGEQNKQGRIIAEIQAQQIEIFEDTFEKLSIDAVFSGQIAVVGNGVNRMIDFGRPAEMEITDLGAGNYWNLGSCEPVADILEATVKMGSKGKRPDVIVGRHATVRLLVDQLKDDKGFDARGIDNGTLTYKSFAEVDGTVYYGRLSTGLEIWGYDGTYTDTDGNIQNAVPEKKVALLSLRNDNLDAAAMTPNISDHIAPIARNEQRVVGARGFASSLSLQKKVLEIEAEHSRCPILADVYSAFIIQVLA